MWVFLVLLSWYLCASLIPYPLSTRRYARGSWYPGRWVLGGWGVLNHQGFHVWGGGAGKVHGSLARAGKVRGQTPKVAKQDKKKKPTGRAHKRMQYNRRFVTAGTPQETSTFSSPVFFVFQAYTIWVRVLHLALEFFSRLSVLFWHSAVFFFLSFLFCSCWIWQEEGP